MFRLPEGTLKVCTQLIIAFTLNLVQDKKIAMNILLDRQEGYAP